MNVFLVEHDHAGDKKNIGLFSNFSKVQYAIDKLSNVEGFEDYTEGFNTIKLKVDYYYDFNEILYLIFNYPHKHYTFKHFEV